MDRRPALTQYRTFAVYLVETVYNRINAPVDIKNAVYDISRASVPTKPDNSLWLFVALIIFLTASLTSLSSMAGLKLYNFPVAVIILVTLTGLLFKAIIGNRNLAR